VTKTLRVGLVSEIRDLDPALAWDVGSIMLMMQCLESPFDFSVGGALPQPLLFSDPLEREPSSNDFIYGGRLRPGARFSDGREVTVDEVVASIANVPSIRQRATVEAEGDRVLFRCATEQPYLAALLGPQGALVYRREGDRILGTGPFQISDRTPDEIRLTRNPHYDGDIALDEIVFRSFPADENGACESLCRAISSGEIDFSNMLMRDDIMGLSGVRKHIVAGNSTCLLYLNTRRSPLDRADFRRALACSLDRLALAKTCYTNALAFRATSILPRVLGSASDGLEHDPGRAKELLGAVEFDRSRPLKLLTVWAPRPYLPKPQILANAVAAQLDEIGVSIEVEVANHREEYVRRAYEGDYDLLLSGWIIESPYPGIFLEQLLASHNAPRDGVGDDEASSGGANFSFWRDEETDRLISDYHAERSEERLGRLLDVVSSEVPLIPLIYGAAAIATSFRVRNFTSGVENLFDYRVFHLDVDEL